jgi:hypothetical protein
MRATLARVKLELYQRRHEPVKETGKWLGAAVSGYYQYFCVPGNLPMMAHFRHRVKRLWRRALIRRGGQPKPSWEPSPMAEVLEGRITQRWRMVGGGLRWRCEEVRWGGMGLRRRG